MGGAHRKGTLRDSSAMCRMDPSPTEMTVMTASAPNVPAKTAVLGCWSDRSTCSGRSGRRRSAEAAAAAGEGLAAFEQWAHAWVVAILQRATHRDEERLVPELREKDQEEPLRVRYRA